jgi:phosphoserine phosphatase
MYKQIFFDFDSTLANAETLDMLGDFAGVGTEVRKLTDASMNGDIPMEEIFERKVDMIAPSREMIDRVNTRNLLTEGMEETIAALQKLGKEVFILTSNFTILVEPWAKKLNIAPERIIGNELFFDDEGNYLGMNMTNPLAHGGGKRIVIEQHVKEKEFAVMIGDSVSDMATQPSVAKFIGFGGIVARDRVREGADVFVEDSNAQALLEHILTEEERAQL